MERKDLAFTEMEKARAMHKCVAKMMIVVLSYICLTSGASREC